MTETQKLEGRAFTFGEVWTGGEGGWPCSQVEVTQPCGELTNMLQFSGAEIEQIISFGIASQLEGEGLCPEVIVYIMDNNLGQPRCDKHVSPELAVKVSAALFIQT